MLVTILKLKEMINTTEAQTLRETYFAKFFSGDITLGIGTQAFTLTLVDGFIVAVREGIPSSGVNFGISGTLDAWQTFAKHRLFAVALANGLVPTGSPLEFRRNYNWTAHLCKELAKML